MTQTSQQMGSSLAPTSEMTHDAVRASQHIYRRLLDAMSHPGKTWQIIRHPYLENEAPIKAEWMASVVTTLVDHEVSLHVIDSPAFDGLEDVIGRRTRVQRAGIDAADFVVADVNSFDDSQIAAIKIGDLDYPNDGATLLIQVESLDATDGPSLELSGPGIRDSRQVPFGQLTTGFIAARNQATADYPLGIDVIVVDQAGKIMAFPRTTVISVKDGGQ